VIDTVIARFLVILLAMAWLAEVSDADDHFQDLINPSVQYQTIQYFAASDCWSMQEIGGWSEANRSKVADLLFSKDKGIGLSGWRFNLGAGIEKTRIANPWRTCETFETSAGQYDWTRCANQRWFLSAAKARGTEVFIAFCNSPPRRLTRNGLTSIDPKAVLVANNLIPGREKEFADYLGDILDHFRDDPDPGEKINFAWISPINEPQWVWTGGQEGTRASNEDIGRQYKAIAAALTSRHLSTHILGPESGNIPDLVQLSPLASAWHRAAFGDYVALLSGDAHLAAATNRTVAYHAYWSDKANDLQLNRQLLRKKLDQHPQWNAAQTEYCVMEGGRDLTMKTALRAMRIVHADLTIVNVTAWSWWTAVSNVNFKDGLIFTDYQKPGDAENIIPSKLLWAYGNFTRFVRPGMRRVELAANETPHDLNGLMGSAFEDPTTGKFAVVYINTSEKAAAVKLSIAHRPDRRWIAFITSDNPADNLRECPVANAGDPIMIPAKSVVTLINPAG
jgi:hypothetical protein